MTAASKIIIADDHAIVRVGVRYALEGLPTIRLVGEAEDFDVLLGMLEAAQPDLVLLDINMPGALTSPVDRVRYLCNRYPTLHVIIYTAYGDAHIANLLIKVGAAAVVRKDQSNDELVAAIQRVVQGDQIPAVIRERNDDYEPSLTPREFEVLLELSRGATPDEIAASLNISPHTLRKHLQNIYPKLRVSGITEAALYAAQWRGIAPLDTSPPTKGVAADQNTQI